MVITDYRGEAVQLEDNMREIRGIHGFMHWGEWHISGIKVGA